MKNKLYALTAIVTAFALAACGGAQRPGELDPEGIGPVRLGMQIGEVPPQAEGWYDAIEVEHTDESFDDLEYETIPASTTICSSSTARRCSGPRFGAAPRRSTTSRPYRPASATRASIRA